MISGDGLMSVLKSALRHTLMSRVCAEIERRNPEAISAESDRQGSGFWHVLCIRVQSWISETCFAAEPEFRESCEPHTFGVAAKRAEIEKHANCKENLPEKSGFASEKSARMKESSESANFAVLRDRDVREHEETAIVRSLNLVRSRAPARWLCRY